MKRTFYVLFCLVLVLFPGRAPAQLDDPLPIDPRLVTGRLDNGLGYVVVEHDNPPGRAAMWLHVRVGSLQEREHERGISHFLEHLAFNGSENFAPGELIRYFESIGLRFGQHQNAHTGYDQTVYKIELPDADDGTIDKGMLFLSDVAFRLLLDAERIEAERRIIMEEKRMRSGAFQRANEYILENIAPGSLLSRRSPIGTEETILGMQREDFVDFYERWYVPSNMVLIAVADREPEDLIEFIQRHFGGAEDRDIPPRQDASIEAVRGHRAIIAADPELVNAEAGLSIVGPAREREATVGQLRVGLVEEIGSWIFNRRMRDLVSSGEAGFQAASASTGDFFGIVNWTQASARGPTEKWREMLVELAAEIQRARVHGFTDREVADARAALISSAEHSRDAEPTVPARQILGRVSAAIAARTPVMSAGQRLDLLRELLPGITPEEVSESFRGRFRLEDAAFTLKMPSGGDVPEDGELIRLFAAALEEVPEAREEDQRPDLLMEVPPQGGRVAQISQHPATEVWSAWLDNGVRVHYRHMDTRREEVTVVVTLAGGQIEETPANRGISEAAATAWQHPATRSISSTHIRDLMTAVNATVSGRSGQDLMALTVSASTGHLEQGLQLAHLLLTEPYIEPAAFDNFVERQRQLVQARRNWAGGAFQELFWSSILPEDEVRIKQLTREQIEALDRESAQAWLDRLIGGAPIEVAIVGDIDQETALLLAEIYFGGLPERERIGSETLAGLRDIRRREGPIRAEDEVPSTTEQSVVMVGFYGGDSSQTRDRRLLSVASRVLTSRMFEQIREKDRWVYSISASSTPGESYPGLGLFSAGAIAEPGNEDRLAARVAEMYDTFAAEGPTEDEMATVRRQIANALDEQSREPRFWWSRLADLTYRGADLDEVAAGAAAYEPFTAEDVREAFARYYVPENRITVITRRVEPEGEREP